MNFWENIKEMLHFIILQTLLEHYFLMSSESSETSNI